MKANFSEEEKTLLRGKIRPLARKFGVSHTYVTMVMSGEREISTPLTQRIYEGLREAVEFFKPID